MIKAVIFDIDGVLVDSFDANVKFFSEIFSKAGYVPPTREQYRHMFHISMYDLIRLIAKNPDEKEMARIVKIAKSVQFPVEEMIVTQESSGVIINLARKYKLGIVTGRLQIGVEEYLELSGMREHFDALVHYEHYDNPKPHPEPLLVALEKLEVSADEAVYVGDQITDKQSAEAAGLPFILFSHHDYGLENIRWRADSFEDIPKLIEEIEKH
jgi:HAD superfamily hydrolase (TIGR01549 family)